MNRNIILYVLIALLVVVGGTWYALSTRSTNEGIGDNNHTEEEQDADNENTDINGVQSDKEETDGGSTSTSNETGTSSSVTEGTSGNSVVNGGSTSPVASESTGEGVSASNGGVQVGVGGTEIVTPQKQRIASELNVQLQILSSIVTIVKIQLQNGDISPQDASNLLDSATEVAEALQVSVDAYLAL